MTKKKIEASNAKFRKMSKARRRVAIAKDVLKQIAAQKLKPVVGSYLEADNFRKEYLPVDGSLQETFQKLPQCQVCAKGALLVCTILAQNKATNAEFKNIMEWDGDELTKIMDGTFSAEQLRLIECEFEGNDVEFYGKTPRERIFPVMELKGLLPASERMTIIMENIIQNKGTFIPVAPK
jgi:hypothetical protein